MNLFSVQVTYAPLLRPIALASPSNTGSVFSPFPGASKKPAFTSQDKYRPRTASLTFIASRSPSPLSNARVFASSNSADFVLVGRSSSTKCKSGNRALSPTSRTWFSSLDRQSRYEVVETG